MPDLADLVEQLLADSQVARVGPAPTSRPRRVASSVVSQPTQVAHGSRLRSARIVGRDPVLGAMRSVLLGTPPGHAAVAGEAGMGKSRLLSKLSDEVAQSGATVARGRGLASGRGALYRPLAELATSLVAQSGAELREGLWPHRAALALLVPGWSDHVASAAERTPGAAPLAELSLSTFAVSEAIVALCAVAGPDVVLVVDDLQWADTETLDVIATLVRRSAGSGYRLLLGAREGEADESLRALEQEGSLTRWRLGPLSEDAARLLCEAVVEARVPPALSQAVAARADGTPLVIEELMNTLVLGGGLVPSGRGRLELRDAEVFGQLPDGYRDSIRARLTSLDAPALNTARVSALIGREFASRQVLDFVGTDEPTLRRSLATLVDRQVLERLTGRTVDHRFVHALTREAVLAELSGPELAALAGALLDHDPPGELPVTALSGALLDHDPPGELPVTALEQRADLALIAGHHERGADLLHEAARLSRRHGGLASAERQLRRVLSIRGARAGDAAVDLVEVLALAGRTEAALETGAAAMTPVSADPAGRARLHLALARVHETLSQPTSALTHLHQAQEAGAGDTALELGRSRVLLAERRLEEAQAAALTALRGHRTAEEVCEALELLARCARTRDEVEAERLLQQMSAVAESNGLASWQLRALSELGTLDLFRLGDGDRLLSARDVAGARGDLVTATVVGYHEAIRRFHGVELSGWERWLDDVQGEAGAYRLDDLEAAMDLLRAAYLLLAGRRAEARSRMDAAAGRPLDPDRTASLWGIAHTVEALLDDDAEAALAAVTRGVGAVRDREFGDPSPMWGTWALLAALSGDDDAADDIRRRGATVNRVNAGLAMWAQAVVEARAGDLEAAQRTAVTAADLLVRAPFYAGVAMRHVLPVALRQGWAQTWHDRALEAADTLAGLGLTHLARALSSASTSRESVHGLTGRELEVLDEVRRGASNAEIAQALFISVRTVEKHVERLLDKTGSNNRTQLATLPRQ